MDEEIRFQNARYLKIVISEALWAALRSCWIELYLDPAEIIAYDASRIFVGQAFQWNADMWHIKTMYIPVEAAQSISIVERCHKPLRGV